VPEELQRPKSPVPERTTLRPPEEQEGVEFVYEIEAPQQLAPIMELSEVLEGMAKVLTEANRVVNPGSDEIVVAIKPFRPGSFIVDLVIWVQNNPALLFLIAQPEAAAQIKRVLAYLGLTGRAKEVAYTLLDLIIHLRNGKPAKVEQAGEKWNYTNQQGQVMPVSPQIHSLVNNGTIQNYFFQLAEPLKRDDVEKIKTYLAKPDGTDQTVLTKREVEAIQAFSEPPLEEPKEEIVENITVEFLNPKSGTYGEADAEEWVFTRAGTKDKIHAHISDEKFLSTFASGMVRFYREDVLKVRLKQRQIVRGTKATTSYDIVRVISYTPAPKPRRSRERT
jgi:hypothetical protein